jgi:Transposase DDE domain
LCFPRRKTSTPVSRSLHKSTLDFLKAHSPIPVEGNHLRRLTTFAAMVCSCIRTKSSSLEGISRPEGGARKQSESCIKQAKRWVSSKWTDWETFFAPYARALLGKIAARGELLLVMDGSETASGCVTLMLSVVWRGYALPLAWITRRGSKGHFPEDLHLDLLALAQGILPCGTFRVVLLGDGEFDGERLRKRCNEWEWQFVLRTSLDRKVDCGGEQAPLGALCPAMGEEAVFLPDACQGDNAVLWWARGFERPVPLLTNMDLGQMACEYYRRRFKVETLFKQLKSAGFHLHKCMVEGAERVRNLIMVVALAFIFTFCAGLLMKKLPNEVIKSFARADRTGKMMPITLAQKCIGSAWEVALLIFSNLSMNWDKFFLDST